MLAFLLASSCQGEYPLPPTLCDHWCAAAQRSHCQFDDPVECIVDCEEMRTRISGCDIRVRALADCANALPETAFVCDEGHTKRTPETCFADNEAMLICLSGEATSWWQLCDRWANRCAYADPTGPPPVGDAGDPLERFQRACTAPYGFITSPCTRLETALVQCLNARELSCDVLPSEGASCVEERLALDACHPRFVNICNAWSFVCGSTEIDGGADASLRTTETCLASPLTQTGQRCAVERNHVYECLNQYWTHPSGNAGVRRECDVLPTEVTSCQAEKAAFDFCATSQRDGGFASD
ncbi:MAG TPA: hypothetical protein VK540_21415 [Polyangiaceae bacterium]|nr:hypothetical protein [Polyangiaceae bacterium]